MTVLERAEPGMGAGPRQWRPGPACDVPGGRPRRVPLSRLGQWVLLIALATAALTAGVELRIRYFLHSAPIRFTGDINNAFRQGRAVYGTAAAAARESRQAAQPTLGEVLAAYRGRYDAVFREAQARRPGTSQYGLDYPPARLLTMTLWVWHIKSRQPDAERWVDPDLWPLLWFNTLVAAIGAAGVFLLVRHWSIAARAREHPLEPMPRAWDGIWAPFIAACLFWFNAALLSNAHTWPQWDVWLLPGYIWAAWLASRGWWFTAGVSVAAACMFKGQVLIVAPVLVLWPLFQGRLEAVARALIGFLFAMALMAAGWLWGGAAHGRWMAGVALAAVLIGAWVMLRNRRAQPERTGADSLPIADCQSPNESIDNRQSAIDNAAKTWRRWVLPAMALIGAAVVLAAAWPWGVSDAAMRPAAHGLLVAALALPLVWRRNFRWGVWAAAIAAGVLLLGPVLFDGSFAWAHVGFVGPTDNHRGLHTGITYNLAALLARRFGWSSLDQTVDWAGGMTLQHFSRVLYAVLLALVAAGLAMHSARRSRATLVALAAPWLIMFAVLMQMHERYLTYAAAVSAILVGYHFGFVLLHLLITALATMLLHTPEPNARWWPEMYRIIGGAFPGASWAVLLLAAVFLWVSIVPEWRKSPRV